MKKSLVLAVVAALLVTCIAVSHSVAAGPTKFKPRELKMGVTSSDTSTWTVSARKFAELVEQRTGGAVKVGIFPNSQLASGNQIKELEMLQNGAIDFTVTSTIFYTNLEQKFTVLTMPFLFSNYAQVDKFQKGPLAQEILALAKPKGITGLALGENGFRQVTNSKREIKTPEDIKGLKIRIPGIKMYISAWKAMGANPLSMSFGEVFGALQQKVVDGQENPLDIIASSKIYEVQKYMTTWNYSYDALIYGVNTANFESWEPELREVVVKSIKEAAALQIKLNRDKDATNLKTIKDKGVVVYAPTKGDLAKFKAAVAPVYDEYRPIVGADLLKKFQNLTK